MAEEHSLKSSFDLAMERLRKKDADEGVEQTSVTEEQKAAIAEVRNFYGAKIAEQEILHQSALRATADPAARDAIDAELRRDRERLTSERDAKIKKIREAK